MVRFCLVVVCLAIAGLATAADPPKTADLIRQLEAGTAGERTIAAEQLGDRGPAAADAIPALTRVARAARRESKDGLVESQRANRHLYRAAIDALVGIGPKSVPALVELLPGEKGDSFGEIAGHLASFGRDAAPAVPALAKLLADENQDFRVTVAGILEELGPAAEPAIRTLIDLFLNPKNKNDNRGASGPLPPPPRVAAVRALVRIGSPKAAAEIAHNVLPVLIEELRTGEHHPGGSPFEILSVLGEAGAPVVPFVVDVISKKEASVRGWDAGEALLALGATGRKEFGRLLAGADADIRRALVPELNGYLWHERFPRYYRFDRPPLDITPFVPALVKALKDPEPDHRLAAAWVLCELGEKAPLDVVDAVADLYRDPAIKKLADEKGWLSHEPRLHYFGEPGVRAIVPLLDSDSPAVRKIAIGQLSRSPRKWAEPALPRLRKLTEDANAILAGSAAYTVAELSLDPKDVIAVAPRRFVFHSDWEVRADAAHHLKWLGPLGAPHLDALVPLLDDKNDKVVQAAASAIYYHAPKGSAAARALTDRKLVQDRRYQFVVMPDAPPERPPGVPELVRLLSDEDDYKRPFAALDLGDRGPPAKEAVAALKKLLTDPDPDLRFAAGYALARIENDQPALRRLLTTEFERAARGRPAAWIAPKAFARLPPDFPELIPHVVRWLERYPTSTVLTTGLQKYGPKAKDAVPVLRKVLRGPAVPVHAYMATELKPACEALGAIGPAARGALPELRQLLDTGGVETALTARDAIRKIEGGK